MGIEPHLPARGMSHGISLVAAPNLGYTLELQRGYTFESPLCSSKSEFLSSYDKHLGNLNKAWQDNTDTSGGAVGDQASLSSFHRHIGISINFQEESGLGTF